MKKLLFSLGSVASIVAPVAAVVACGSKTEAKEELKTDLAKSVLAAHEAMWSTVERDQADNQKLNLKSGKTADDVKTAVKAYVKEITNLKDAVAKADVATKAAENTLISDALKKLTDTLVGGYADAKLFAAAGLAHEVDQVLMFQILVDGKNAKNAQEFLIARLKAPHTLGDMPITTADEFTKAKSHFTTDSEHDGQLKSYLDQLK